MFNNLRDELDRKNIKLRELADILHISLSTLNGKLNGDVEFTLSEIYAVAALFPEDTVEYLFSNS